MKIGVRVVGLSDRVGREALEKLRERIRRQATGSGPQATVSGAMSDPSVRDDGAAPAR